MPVKVLIMSWIPHNPTNSAFFMTEFLPLYLHPRIMKLELKGLGRIKLLQLKNFL